MTLFVQQPRVHRVCKIEQSILSRLFSIPYKPRGNRTKGTTRLQREYIFLKNLYSKSTIGDGPYIIHSKDKKGGTKFSQMITRGGGAEYEIKNRVQFYTQNICCFVLIYMCFKIVFFLNVGSAFLCCFICSSCIFC